jgi:23S rRNA (cytosine1962-C5)-methyltransferase
MAKLVLKPGREKTIKRKHPWLFSGAVARLDGEVSYGEVVDVVSAGGEVLGKAAYSQHSQIAARMWTFDPHQVIDDEYIHKLVHRAVDLRLRSGLQGVTDAYRLIHGESDGIPGFIADRYADTLVVQVLSAGAEVMRGSIIRALKEITQLENIFERSDADVRKLEGLPERVGQFSGQANWSNIQIVEHGIHYQVNVAGGQKTGFYLDQRANRKIVGDLCKGKRVLNCFCYTGGFSLAAARGGASEVISIDSSAEALETARINSEINGLGDHLTWLEADVFQSLRTFRDRGEQFDVIVLDPPKFAPTASQVPRASRAYKDINLLALKLLCPGGVLATFSCSGGVSADLFQKIVADAALDAHADAVALQHLHQDVDHPVSLAFPEGAYLKGLVIVKTA